MAGPSKIWAGLSSVTELAKKSDIPTVINSLSSTSTNSALSAYQGKVLNDKIAGSSSSINWVTIGSCYSKTFTMNDGGSTTYAAVFSYSHSSLKNGILAKVDISLNLSNTLSYGIIGFCFGVKTKGTNAYFSGARGGTNTISQTFTMSNIVETSQDYVYLGTSSLISTSRDQTAYLMIYNNNTCTIKINSFVLKVARF